MANVTGPCNTLPEADEYSEEPYEERDYSDDPEFDSDDDFLDEDDDCFVRIPSGFGDKA